MKRTELYALVWAKPMTRLAAELGISDVGLAKACRRHAIPVPPRGHWAKLQAGKAGAPVPLPQPELDMEVPFTTTPPARRLADAAQKRESKRVVTEKVEAIRDVAVPPKTVDNRPHPLVRATAEYIARLPARLKRSERMTPFERLRTDHERLPPLEHGRWLLNVPNGLILTVSDVALTWALDFFDRLFRALAAANIKVVRREGRDREPDAIECVMGDERLCISFREGYRRIKLTAAEFAQAKAKESWAREWAYRPSATFAIDVRGTEPAVSKTWTGHQAKLDSLVEEMAATCLVFLELQPTRRKERHAEERRRRDEAERAERVRRIQQARHAQLEQAFKAAEAFERTAQLERFLAVVESELDTYKAPYGERARVWLGVVREELNRSTPYLKILGESLTVPSWSSWPPAWWPTTENDGDEPVPSNDHADR